MVWDVDGGELDLVAFDLQMISGISKSHKMCNVGKTGLCPHQMTGLGLVDGL